MYLVEIRGQGRVTPARENLSALIRVSGTVITSDELPGKYNDRYGHPAATSPDQLVELAAAALYKAKRDGRNRVATLRRE